MNRFRADLKAAGIPFIDADGARADFHALRHTFCTNLQRSGVAQRVLMSLMRQGDRRLSDHVYTDSKLLPDSAAVESLPSFAAAQIVTQKTDASGHLVSPESNDGARYRVRTCDPYRVKVVLYR